jgi:hypothetical protein
MPIAAIRRSPIRTAAGAAPHPGRAAPGPGPSARSRRRRADIANGAIRVSGSMSDRVGRRDPGHLGPETRLYAGSSPRRQPHPGPGAGPFRLGTSTSAIVPPGGGPAPRARPPRPRSTSRDQHVPARRSPSRSSVRAVVPGLGPGHLDAVEPHGPQPGDALQAEPDAPAAGSEPRGVEAARQQDRPGPLGRPDRRQVDPARGRRRIVPGPPLPGASQADQVLGHQGRAHSHEKGEVWTDDLERGAMLPSAGACGGGAQTAPPTRAPRTCSRRREHGTQSIRGPWSGGCGWGRPGPDPEPERRRRRALTQGI